MNEVHVRISDDYEQNREVKARAMYNYLASRGLLRKGIGAGGEWEALDQETRNLINMVASYAEPSVVVRR